MELNCKKYLLQIKYDDGDITNKIVTVSELINFIDMLDCYCCIEDYQIYDLSEFGKVKRLYYTGWQPRCIIEIADEDGKIAIRGEGTDH